MHIVRDTKALEDVQVVRPAASSTEDVEGQSRSVVARRAYREGDKELSKLAHETLAQGEDHMNEAGQYIKAAVFGGLDGIITTFAVVASVAGANLPTGIVIIMVGKRVNLSTRHTCDAQPPSARRHPLTCTRAFPQRFLLWPIHTAGVLQSDCGRHLNGLRRVCQHAVGEGLHPRGAQSRGMGVRAVCAVR